MQPEPTKINNYFFEGGKLYKNEQKAVTKTLGLTQKILPKHMNEIVQIHTK